MHFAPNKNASRPVSRVLYGPRRLAATGTWRPFVLDRCCHRPHATYPDGGPETALRVTPQPPLFGLAPGGVCRAAPVASRAVGSYPTLSPLPRFGPAFSRRNRGGLLSVALSLGSPPPAINRHRVSMEPGLSSPAAFRLLLVRPPGRLAGRIKAFAYGNATEKRQERAKSTVPQRRRYDASPCRNSRARPGSCAWRRGRHCISGSSRRSFHRRVSVPWRDTSCRI